MWSSEPVPFDPMEKTLHRVYEQTQQSDKRREYLMFHEYPLEGKPPMMTHLFENKQKERIIAAKGAPEAILNVCTLPEQEKERIRVLIREFGLQGYRVLGVAGTDFKGEDFPKRQQEFEFGFIGLVVFYDPPKKGIDEVFRQVYDAGIKVKVITGDNADTTKSIAQQAGIVNTAEIADGKELIKYTEEQLMRAAEKKGLVYPDVPRSEISRCECTEKTR
ncbi:hypothetical protein ANCCEY_15158 [Ancylostoma ceylanicum]|uniref:IC domain protein, HAD ATPase, P-type family n=1 Tax=Ancylostoma ceylanicum TaxID=53326 RepID=A0A0D6L4D5_9BILA|nr:hypothetical protein ANCCEY_15158 [Ancylostoma ceylanicum]